MLNGPATDTMVRKKRFVLIFDDLRSVHLFKDVGQIPFQLQRHFDYDVEIVCRRNEAHYLYLNDALKGLKLVFHEGCPYRYLLRHARDIDVLMLFHISTGTIRRGLLYKFINPQGCLYVKADMSGDSIRYARWGERNIITQARRMFLFSRFVKRVDLVSFETERSYRGVTTIPPEKKLLLPNGFDPDFIDWYGVRRRQFHEKEDIILLVGRHGDYAKNSELMFDIISKIGNVGGWQVWFVGPMTSEFEQFKSDFLRLNPRMAGVVVCTGQINDKQELFDLYSRAKMLCLTSRWESWGMVCVEAMAFGCVPVMAPVSSAEDITNNRRSGVVIDSHDALVWAAELQRLIDSLDILEKLSTASQEHFGNSFKWQQILFRLDTKIRNIRGMRYATASQAT